MFTRTVSVDDLARLKAQLEEADRAYNEALSQLDAARLRGPLDPPQPPPGLDEYQITPLNQHWEILAGAQPPAGGWRGRLAGVVWRVVARVFDRQQAFNARVVDHINRNVSHHRELRASIGSTIAFVGDQLRALEHFELLVLALLQRLTPFIETKDLERATLGRRITEDAREIVDILDHRTVGLGGAIGGVTDELLKRWESMVARERRYDAKVAGLTAAHEELRGTLAVVQQASLTLKREFERLRTLSATGATGPAGATATAGVAGRDAGGAPAAPPAAQTSTRVDPTTSMAGTAGGPAAPRVATPAPLASSIDSYKYVGFEDRFRGSQEDIRARLTEYLPYFEGASDVLDIGCGRGEFLDLLRERGTTGRGLDVNHEMVEVCLARGLDVAEGDALGYLASLPDGSLGGLLAAQVVEHLEPNYLLEMLDVAYHKLRPGSHIILETINAACWFAFFSSYIRDITHVRPLHPDTLSYLLTASGFQRVSVRYAAPYPPHEKLQPLPTSEGPQTEVFNANVDKLNSLLFTHLDYAAIGVRL